MQIVIDIPEDTYKRTKFYKEFRDLNDCVLVLKAIDHAIELPKGHGRLKDVDKIINDGRSKGFCDWYDEMKYADTIIEAESEVKI